VSIVLELSPELESNIQRGHPPALAWFAGLIEIPAGPGFVVMKLVQNARNESISSTIGLFPD
jgi:hypothetical protein